ncbi:MAG TPA: hypothetical protein VM243_06400, partial [Phycisphaerae bacterium]|nr:hypothetical protein [Phycisphaerae bacterium]
GLFLVGVAASGGVGYAHPRLRDAFLYPYNLAPDHLQGVRFAENGVFGGARGGLKWELREDLGNQATRQQGNQAVMQQERREVNHGDTEARRRQTAERQNCNSEEKRPNRREHKGRRELPRDWVVWAAGGMGRSPGARTGAETVDH